ncbi:MAG TPA: hypothetical protein VMP01_09950 [Pirellulaceae bacterium]|nr:hypothetical protein [Pirellulaceae bacterium]
MSNELWEAGRPRPSENNPWSPSQTTRFWLPIGIVALLADLSLGIAATALELAHWGKDGLTPDVVVGFAAIVPQTLIVAAYLVLARDASARGLYKSMAGLFASYLLLSLLSLAVLEVLRGGWNSAIMIAAGVGIIGLVVFTFSSWPKFATSQETAASETAAPPHTQEGSGAGCWIHLAILLALVLGKRLLRNANNFLPNLGFGIGDWAVLEMLVLMVIGLAYAGWFAAAKIQHRGKLGWPAAALGITEISIVLAHVGMVVALIALVLSAVAVNPQLDEDDLDKFMDAWLKRGAIASAACHGLWALATAAFFASLWLRPPPDWRDEFLMPGPGRSEIPSGSSTGGG